MINPVSKINLSIWMMSLNILGFFWCYPLSKHFFLAFQRSVFGRSTAENFYFDESLFICSLAKLVQNPRSCFTVFWFSCCFWYLLVLCFGVVFGEFLAVCLFLLLFVLVGMLSFCLLLTLKNFSIFCCFIVESFEGLRVWWCSLVLHIFVWSKFSLLSWCWGLFFTTIFKMLCSNSLAIYIAISFFRLFSIMICSCFALFCPLFSALLLSSSDIIDPVFFSSAVHISHVVLLIHKMQ